MDLEVAKLSTKDETELSVEYAAHLLYLSFPFSQGSNLNQDYIYKYLHIIHNSWRLSQEQVQTISEIFVPRARLLIWGDQGENKPLMGKLHTDRSVEIEGKSDGDEIEMLENTQIKEVGSYEAGQMRLFLSGMYPESLDDVLFQLTRGILGKDHAYLLEQEGRPRSPDSISDRWLSHFCYYALEGKPSGCLEYNRMFADLRNYFLRAEEMTRMECFAKADAVVAKYLETHPDSSLRPEFPYIAG